MNNTQENAYYDYEDFVNAIKIWTQKNPNKKYLTYSKAIEIAENAGVTPSRKVLYGFCKRARQNDERFDSVHLGKSGGYHFWLCE